MLSNKALAASRTTAPGPARNFQNWSYSNPLALLEGTPDRYPRSIAYGNGVYVYAGNSGGVATSTDAITWTARTSGTTSAYNALIYSTFFVAVGFGGSISTTTNGITWTARTSGTTTIIRSITYGNGIYIYGASSGVLATSTDAITWTARTSGTTDNIVALKYSARERKIFYTVDVSSTLGTALGPFTVMGYSTS